MSDREKLIAELREMAAARACAGTGWGHGKLADLLTRAADAISDPAPSPSDEDRAKRYANVLTRGGVDRLASEFADARRDERKAIAKDVAGMTLCDFDGESCQEWLANRILARGPR